MTQTTIGADDVYMLAPQCPPVREMLQYRLHRRWKLTPVPIERLRHPMEDGISDKSNDPFQLQGWQYDGANISRALRPPVNLSPSAPAIIRYTDNEYPESPEWSRQETDHLFDLAEHYGERWPVIHDRFIYRRSLVDCKARYHAVLGHVQQQRGLPVAEYDPQVDLERRNLIKQISEDKLLVRELQELQLNIQDMAIHRDQLQRDHVSDGLARLTLTQIVGEQKKKKKKRTDVKQRRSLAPIGEDSDASLLNQSSRTSGVKKEKKVTGGITLRSQTLPPFKSIVTQQKIDSIMQELGILNIPTMPTAAVVSAYEELHKGISQLIELRRQIDKFDGPSRERSLSVQKDDDDWQQGQLKRQQSQQSLSKDPKRRKV